MGVVHFPSSVRPHHRFLFLDGAKTEILSKISVFAPSVRIFFVVRADRGLLLNSKNY